jgi:hypothetical protein
LRGRGRRESLVIGPFAFVTTWLPATTPTACSTARSQEQCPSLRRALNQVLGRGPASVLQPVAHAVRLSRALRPSSGRRARSAGASEVTACDEGVDGARKRRRGHESHPGRRPDSPGALMHTVPTDRGGGRWPDPRVVLKESLLRRGEHEDEGESESPIPEASGAGRSLGTEATGSRSGMASLTSRSVPSMPANAQLSCAAARRDSLLSSAPSRSSPLGCPRQLQLLVRRPDLRSSAPPFAALSTRSWAEGPHQPCSPWRCGQPIAGLSALLRPPGPIGGRF